MNVGTSGIRASELIAMLKRLVELHGDRPVHAAMGDYPDGVSVVRWHTQEEAYIPAKVFLIR